VPAKSFRTAPDLREYLDRLLALQLGPPSCAACSRALRGTAYRPVSCGGDSAEAPPGEAEESAGQSPAVAALPPLAAVPPPFPAREPPPQPLLCGDCLFSLGPQALSTHVAVPGVSLLPAPPPPPTSSSHLLLAPDARLRAHCAELLDSLAALRSVSAASADPAAAAAAAQPSLSSSSSAAASTAALASSTASSGGATPPSAGSVAQPAPSVDQQVVEQVLSSLNDLRLAQFAGAEALLTACVEPVRAAVVACLPQALRASTPQVLQTPDLARLPRPAVAALAGLCEAQVAAFAELPGAAVVSPAVDLWRCEGDADSGEISLLAGGAASDPLALLFPAASGAAHPYPPWQRRAARLHAALALSCCAAVAPAQALARRFVDLLKEATSLAQERTELLHLAQAARDALARLLAEHEGRPVVSRPPPVRGDMVGATLQVQQAVLAWEDALCAGMHVRWDADASLGTRRAAVAAEQLKSASDRLHGVQRQAEASRARDEDEHRRAFRALGKLRGAEGERQRTAAGAALEQRRLLRQHDLQAAQQRVSAADAAAREASAMAESARKQRDSLAGWREHVRHAAEALQRANMHPENSPAALAHGSTAQQLFRNNREMFYHDDHFAALRNDLTQRARDCEAAVEELTAVRKRPLSRARMPARACARLPPSLACVGSARSALALMRSYPRFLATAGLGACPPLLRLR